MSARHSPGAAERLRALAVDRIRYEIILSLDLLESVMRDNAVQVSKSKWKA